MDAVLGLRFARSGALLEGHFRLSSGLHSPGYLQCALVLQHPAHAEALGRALAGRLRALGATVVLSPALGGLIIGHEVGARARRPRDLRRAAGRRADAAPRLLARPGRSRRRHRRRRHDRRIDARDDGRRDGGGRDRRRRRRRSSIAAAARRRSACRSHALATLTLADLPARRLPAVRGRAAGREAGVAGQ